MPWPGGSPVPTGEQCAVSLEAGAHRYLLIQPALQDESELDRGISLYLKQPWALAFVKATPVTTR
jgi:hypothetical protein